MKVVAFVLLVWFAVSSVAFSFEHVFFHWHMKKLGISFNPWLRTIPRYLSEVYRAWGEANGVDVDYRLKIRKYLAVNWLCSLIGLAVGLILLKVIGTNPSTLQ